MVMSVEKDLNNRYDRFALSVKMPDGRMVGHVPANLCRILSELLDEAKITKISCIAVGSPCSSKYVDPRQSFRRNPKQRNDREGGGAVIPCKFVLKTYDSCYDKVIKTLQTLLKSKDLEGPVIACS